MIYHIFHHHYTVHFLYCLCNLGLVFSVVLTRNPKVSGSISVGIVGGYLQYFVWYFKPKSHVSVHYTEYINGPDIWRHKSRVLHPDMFTIYTCLYWRLWGDFLRYKRKTVCIILMITHGNSFILWQITWCVIVFSPLLWKLTHISIVVFIYRCFWRSAGNKGNI